MDLDVFLRERRPRWDRLQGLLDRADQDRDPHPRTIQDIVRLYRLACSDLNHARTLTAEPALLDRLNLLTGRGYRYVYRDTRRSPFGRTVAEFFRHEVPGAFRRRAGAVGLSGAALLLGSLLGFLAVLQDPANARRIIPATFYHPSPAERVAELEKNPERVSTMEVASAFSASLFTHNIQVSFLAFSLGAVSILGGLAVLFFNGALLGAIAAQYLRDGVSTFFLAWVGPHGALELPSIVFAGAAGLIAGRALLLPGDRTPGSALREAMPDLRRILLGTAVFLVLAGLVEGSFSQFTARTFSYATKISVAGLLLFLLVAYLFTGRRPGVERR